MTIPGGPRDLVGPTGPVRAAVGPGWANLRPLHDRPPHAGLGIDWRAHGIVPSQYNIDTETLKNREVQEEKRGSKKAIKRTRERERGIVVSIVSVRMGGGIQGLKLIGLLCDRDTLRRVTVAPRMGWSVPPAQVLSPNNRYFQTSSASASASSLPLIFSFYSSTLPLLFFHSYVHLPSLVLSTPPFSLFLSASYPGFHRVHFSLSTWTPSVISGGPLPLSLSFFLRHTPSYTVSP